MRIIKDHHLEELILKCCKGNLLAQKKLYDRFSGKMYGLCLRYTRNTLDAQDILQEGFIKVYGNLESFENKGSFEGWMKRIFINTALRFIEKNNRLKFTEEIQEDEAIFSVEYNHCEYNDLLCYVNKLPAGYRAVFNLNVIDGYNHEEIGDMLNISKNTSRSQLNRARKLLQQMIIKGEPLMKEGDVRI